jgi:hypothetical protein
MDKTVMVKLGIVGCGNYANSLAAAGKKMSADRSGLLF